MNIKCRISVDFRKSYGRMMERLEKQNNFLQPFAF